MKQELIGSMPLGCGTFDGSDVWYLLTLEPGEAEHRPYDHAVEEFRKAVWFDNGPRARFCHSITLHRHRYDHRKFIAVAHIRWDV